jgi:type I restriction enzyme S subunit
MSWENRNFRELGFLGRGKSRHRPRNDESLYGGKYPMIQTGDVKAANFYITSFSQTYNEKGLSQSKLWEPDTLCITIAANIAETAILGMHACFPDSIIGFIADEEKSDVRFIKYFFDIYKERMQRISQGATQDNLSLEKLLTFEVPTPPLQTQKRIADILSAYDDLIENNLKRIKLLEQAAQNIYKEWFTHLRFPGHENVDINEKSGLPVGWNQDFLDNQLDKVRRIGKLKKDDYLEFGDFPIIDQSNGFIGGYSNDRKVVQFEPLPLVIFGDHTRRVKYVNFPFISGADGTQLLSPLNKNMLPAYFYLSIKSIDLSDYAYARHYKYLKQQTIIIPNDSILKLFNDKVCPMLEQGIKLLSYNTKLKTARDILLPRLMNRTIEV